MTKPNEFPKNITDSYYSQQFELVNEELRRHFRLANNEIEQVKEKVNELVQTVHDEHNNWSLNKIAQYIYSKPRLGWIFKTNSLQ